MANEALRHYRILEKIGAEASGVVFKALDTRLDRLAAIQFLPVTDSKRRRQFTLQARAASALRHPNIITIYDAGSEDGKDFLVMEYVPGRALSEILPDGPLPIGVALQYAKQIASALEAAHRAGIVHGDLKPSHILVTPEGGVKLAGFGMARLQQPASTQESDVLSFGAVLSEMATGSPGSQAMATLIGRCRGVDTYGRVPKMEEVRRALQEITVAPQSRSRRIDWPRVLSYGGMLTTPALAGWLLLGGHSTRRTISTPVPLTSFQGVETNAAWSPDGRQIAFAWNGESQDNFDIFVMQPGSSRAVRLNDDPGDDWNPAWSPDGERIAFTHREKGSEACSINVVSPRGGSVSTLIESKPVLDAPTWSPDGQSLFYESGGSADDTRAIWNGSIRTDERRQITSPPSGIPGDFHPSISPDGRTLAFCRKTGWRVAELYLADLKPDLTLAAPPRRVTELGYVSGATWTPDGKRVLFEAHREGIGIWQIDRDGGNLRPVPGVPDSASNPAVARRRDGRLSLVFTDEAGENAIRRYRLGQDAAESAVELVPSSRSQSYPRYSNDGTRLAFSSTRTGYQEIWVANADGSEPRQLTNFRHQLTEVGHWSPSDDIITFVTQDRGERELYSVSSQGGVPLPLTHEPGVEYGTGWARDGAWYYFNATHRGRTDVWKAARGGGQIVQVTTSGGACGFESTQGHLRYWRAGRSGEAGVLLERTQRGDREVPLVPPGRACVTAAAQQGFYYKAASTEDIHLYDESRGISTRVLKRPAKPFNLFTVSPDGRWFAADFVDSTSVDLMIIDNLAY